ncbi:MAG: MBL fold metallo-hydrolase [Deltaproteobacteria bacterium]|nr:MBL fold metallo-hydrolase [Deltaproteobacteria bacterium]
MSRLYSAEFINGYFEDPGLFVSFLFQKRAILFDLGDIHALSEKNILKIERIFITHTHIDHFAGFERLIRIMLGRDKKVYLYGPKGFIKNVEGKLAGYNWNLIKKYKNNFEINVYEILDKTILSRKYICNMAFEPIILPDKPFNCGEIIFEDDNIIIKAAILDHGIECLGFSMEEKFRVNIIKEALEKLGVEKGRWLAEFKQNLIKKISGKKYNDKISADNKLFDIEELAEKIAKINFGEKLAYISDVRYTKENINTILPLAQNANNLFIEAVFAHVDNDLAALKNHLTAKQAGKIARLAKAKKISVFHFSPRYKNQEDLLINEAASQFNRNR